MQQGTSLRIQLIIDFTSHIPMAGDLAKRKDEFIVALNLALEAEDLAPLQRSQSTPDTFTALIEPPTRIGEAMLLAREFLNQCKLKRRTSVGFEKV